MLPALEAFFTADASLWSLFMGSLLAATLVPVSSEAMLFAVLKLHPDLYWPAIAVATAGNSAGGMISYAMGRFIPHRTQVRHEAWLKRRGAGVLLLAWVPLVGDALCVGAGWLRLDWRACLAYMVAGRGLRYLLIAAAT